MSAAFDDVGEAEAIAILAEAKAGDRGIIFGFSHLGAAEVTLYGLLVSKKLGSDRPNPGRSVETGKMQIVIPKQTNFSLPMSTNQRPICRGDAIQWPASSSRYFYVESDSDMQELSAGYAIQVQVLERKTKTIGAKA